jgi:hypothetical protein
MEVGRAGAASTTLYAALAGGALLLVLLPLSPSLKQRFLANHQLRPPSTASWIAIGLLPKMYGGRHELWMSPEPLSEYFRADPARAPFKVDHYWVNHSPGRAVRLDTTRQAAARNGAPVYVRLESRYGDEALVSIYMVRAVDGRIEVRSAP